MNLENISKIYELKQEKVVALNKITYNFYEGKCGLCEL